MKNKLNIFLIASNVIIIALFLMSSTGILISTGTGNPDGSAMLEIKSTEKGLLIPRVDLDDISSNTSPVNAPAEGLMVYNDGGDQAEGFYYWDEDHDQWNSVVNEIKPVRYVLSGNATYGGAYTRINFNQKDFDENSNSPVSVGSSWNYTAQADGYYQVSTKIYYTNGSNTRAYAILAKNNSRVNYLNTLEAKQLSTTVTSGCVLGSDVIKLVKGDKIAIDFYTTGTKTISAGGATSSSVTISYLSN